MGGKLFMMRSGEVRRFQHSVFAVAGAPDLRLSGRLYPDQGLSGFVPVMCKERVRSIYKVMA